MDGAVMDVIEVVCEGSVRLWACRFICASNSFARCLSTSASLSFTAVVSSRNASAVSGRTPDGGWSRRFRMLSRADDCITCALHRSIIARPTRKRNGTPVEEMRTLQDTLMQHMRTFEEEDIPDALRVLERECLEE